MRLLIVHEIASAHIHITCPISNETLVFVVQVQEFGQLRLILFQFIYM
jgi:hypothetical protein